MIRRTAARRALHALLVTAVVGLAAGCDLQPADLPVPGTGVDGPTYSLQIEFADVLNLPQGAKVIADGNRVGQLTHVTIVDPVATAPDPAARHGYVIARVAIRDSVRLPTGTTAELRQQTPLGDVHIALTTPNDTHAQRLQPDATIPLASTTQSPPIENIMSGLSIFVGTGAITDVFDLVRRTNTVFPRVPADTARISTALRSDLTDLAAHTDSIHALVGGLQSTVDDGMLANAPILDELLSPTGVQHTTDSINATIAVLYLLTATGPVAPASQWLGPLLGSTDGVVRAVVPMLFGDHPLDTDSPSNLKKLVDVLQNQLIPYVERGPKINIVGIDTDPAASAVTSQQRAGRIIDTLRMIGAVR